MTKDNHHHPPDVWIEIRGHLCLTFGVIYIHRFSGCPLTPLEKKN